MSFEDEDITANYHKGNPRSREAHQRTKKRKGALQRRITEFMKPYPSGFIWDEIEKETKIPHQSGSSRWSQMKKHGAIIPTGEKRRTRSNCPADVWTLPSFSVWDYEPDDPWNPFRMAAE